MSEIRFRDIKLEGGWLMVKPEREDLGKAMALVRKHKNKLYELVVKEFRKKRSLNANAYAWVLIGKLAEAMHITPEEVYLGAVRGLGGNFTVCTVHESELDRFIKSWQHNGLGWPAEPVGSGYPGWINVVCFHGSSTYDTAQMARLIDNLVQDCKALDIETLPPDKLDLLKGSWQ